MGSDNHDSILAKESQKNKIFQTMTGEDRGSITTGVHTNDDQYKSPFGTRMPQSIASNNDETPSGDGSNRAAFMGTAE
jgi:hypothetical protein